MPSTEKPLEGENGGSCPHPFSREELGTHQTVLRKALRTAWGEAPPLTSLTNGRLHQGVLWPRRAGFRTGEAPYGSSLLQTEVPTLPAPRQRCECSGC